MFAIKVILSSDNIAETDTSTHTHTPPEIDVLNHWQQISAAIIEQCHPNRLNCTPYRTQFISSGNAMIRQIGKRKHRQNESKEKKTKRKMVFSPTGRLEKTLLMLILECKVEVGC